MTSNYYGGQHVNMTGGSHNVGINNGVNAQATPQDALRELFDLVNAMRAQVSPADREVIDTSMRSVGPNVEPGTLRRALGQVAGVATMVGQVGVPVIEAIRKVMAAFGM